MWEEHKENYNVEMSKRFLTFSSNFTNFHFFNSKNWKEKQSALISFEFFSKIINKIELIKKEYPNKKIIFVPEKYEFFCRISDRENEKLKLNYNTFMDEICKATEIINASNFTNDEINQNDYFIIYLWKMYDVYERIDFKNQSITIYFAKLVNLPEKILTHYEKCEYCCNELILQKFYKDKYVISCNRCNSEEIIGSEFLKYKISKCKYCHNDFIQNFNKNDLYCSEYCDYNHKKELRKEWEENSYYYDEDECQPQGANPWD